MFPGAFYFDCVLGHGTAGLKVFKLYEILERVGIMKFLKKVVDKFGWG